MPPAPPLAPPPAPSFGSEIPRQRATSLPPPPQLTSAPPFQPAPPVPPQESAIEAEPQPRRTHYLLIALALLLALAAGGGLVYLQKRDDPAPKPAVAAAQAADALRGQKAASLKVSYFDQGGLDVTGDLTIAKGGATSGTLTDSGGGKAEYLASGGNAAVRGDQDWWARRDSGRVTVLKDHWVRPKNYAFPVEGSGLEPEALAGTVEWVRSGGVSADDVETVAGQPVVGMRRDGWLVLFSRAQPHRLVWLGGPLRTDTPIATGASSGPQAPPYISVLVNPEPDDVKNVSLPKDVLIEEKTAANLPAFDVNVNATTCKTVNCSWTVTVTNTGTVAGTASVIASVSPGMPKTQVKELGKLSPGQTATTPAMSFPNPAPTNKNVPADYQAQVYSPELHGANLKLMRQLQEKGMVPGRSQILSRLDPSQTSAMLFTLDAMAEAPKLDADKAIEAMENTVELGVLPEVGELVRSRRLENPAVLYPKLQNQFFEYDTGASGTPVQEKTGNRRELQIAAGILKQDPDATVRLDTDGVDILVHTSQQRVFAIQTRSVGSDSVAANARSAVKDLTKHAPDGSKRVVLLYVEAPAGIVHAAGRDYFEAQFRPLSSVLCHADLNEVVVVNQTGVQRWTPDQLPGCR
ncbi:hypothetical protein [Actinoplanes sp. L3-i22]|uniref:hypothetical protein n=1 Tax=Actinoplanes sp. L3-i22 TaxID=2836373 RepID=UPI001C8542E6|nr:hypothetical protein [Actinoplanes sp. L3-i22]